MGSHATPQPVPDPRREEDVHPLKLHVAVVFSCQSSSKNFYCYWKRCILTLPASFICFIIKLSLCWRPRWADQNQKAYSVILIWYNSAHRMPRGQQLTITGRHCSADLQPSVLGAGSSTGRSHACLHPVILWFDSLCPHPHFASALVAAQGSFLKTGCCSHLFPIQDSQESSQSCYYSEDTDARVQPAFEYTWGA